MTGYRHLSLWHDTLPEGEIQPRPSLENVVGADVGIIGAGYTGLWTAYYLTSLQPDIKVVVVEAEVAGFGASGRNGGWCTAEMSGDPAKMVAEHGRQAVKAMSREMFGTVDEVGKASAAEGIDCHYHKGGMLTAATDPAQAMRLHHEIGAARERGWGEEDLRWLDQEETMSRSRVEGALGALYTPHAAAIHPARLARGLAEVLERRGVAIFEKSLVLTLGNGKVITSRGAINARTVLLCTEAFTINLPGRKRKLVPLYSLMLATEPLSASVWAKIGLENRELFNDARRLIIYGQRTADDRIAFGGRGARYHYRSAIRSEFDKDPVVHNQVQRTLWSLFPQLEGVRVSHTWGGAVAMARDWRPSITFDQKSGMGWAGGYIGEGVAASNLAGRTLADLVLERDTDIAHLPWVGHVSPNWEPEPLRWLGINLGLKLAPAADRSEARRGRPSRLFGGALRLLTGR